ncbi:glutathione S-transferase [Mycena metata]|uniref:glutathione transferase n=1 Tax=Mycena metata TaxID=1033252 RepID=A0AAD7JH72_9AGAR|nr:glutathione S-transferase [Mycena metata]
MVLKPYSVPLPVGGQGIVALVLAEKQIPFEHIAIDLDAQGHKTPEFLAMHPFGQVPGLDDDGFILYESRAICRYLSEKYSDHGTPLLPKGLKERALVEQAASVEFAHFHPAASKVVREVWNKKNSGLPIDQAAVDAGLMDLSAKLDVYEVILGKQKFLAGDSFTLADLFHFAYGPLLAEGGVDLMTSKGPNVARWWNELLSRPAWIKLKAEGFKGTAS